MKADRRLQVCYKFESTQFYNYFSPIQSRRQCDMPADVQNRLRCTQIGIDLQNFFLSCIIITNKLFKVLIIYRNIQRRELEEA